MNARLKLIVLLLCAVLCAHAVDFGALKPKGYVNDFAGVLDPATVQELSTYCARVEQATGAQIALVTIDRLEGEPIEDVANLLYRKWGVGSKKSDEGVLLLLSIRDRRSRLEVGYGLEPIIPDGYAGGILREMRPSLRTRNYGQALADAARGIGEKVAQSKGVSIGPAPMRRSRPEPEGIPWEVLAVVGGLVLAMLIFGGGRRSGPRGMGGGGGNFLMGMLLGNLLSGGGGRSRSGGGFGGYDSGDSFGGFGGGDSGGGGASSDW